LIVERCWRTKPQRRPKFNEIVYMFCEKSFQGALEVDIRAFKNYRATVAPAQLQAETPVELAERWKVVPASIIGCLQPLAEMADAAGTLPLEKCYRRGIGVRRREVTPPGSGAVYPWRGAG
jgi:hypothetical protein